MASRSSKDVKLSNISRALQEAIPVIKTEDRLSRNLDDVSIFMGVSLKLKVMVQKIFLLSKRLFGVPTFFNYAMADGIYELLKKTKTGIINFMGKSGPPHQNFQLDLFPT